MQLRGLHHVTGICRDLEATIAFYRDVPRPRDRPRRPQRRRPRHAPRVVRPARRRRRGRCCRSWSTRSCPRAWSASARRITSPSSSSPRRSSRRGATTYGARRSSAPTSTTAGVPVRVPAGSGRPRGRDCYAGTGLYTRPPLSVRSRQLRTAHSPSENASHRSPRRRAQAHAAGVRSSSRRSSSQTSGSRKEPPAAGPAPAMLAHEQIGDRHALGLPGQSSTTSATEISPSVTWRLSSARASRTRLACCRARMCCGAGTVAVASIEPPHGPPFRAGLVSYFDFAVLRAHEIQGWPKHRPIRRLPRRPSGSRVLVVSSPPARARVPTEGDGKRRVREDQRSTTLCIRKQRVFCSAESLVRKRTRPDLGKPRPRANFVLRGELIRVGVDVGGTFTDLVALDRRASR